DPRVAAATLTGSEPAGRSVASIAGDEIKPTVLELGGSDPFVVLPSADIARAAEVGVTARCQNNGQSCIAAKRFIVHADVYDTFVTRFVEGLQALRMGDPLDEETQLGPLYSERGRDELHEMVEDARSRGARVLCGGEVPDGPGAFYPATAVDRVTPEMRLWAEEAFGPVATIHAAESADEALRLANDSPFGLGANVWADDPAEQEKFIDGFEAGMVFVNGMVTSFPEIPFGGVKRSGYGRELSAQGIRAFCNAKTVWVGDSASGDASTKTE
ncbi:aldehyde dehydrogenase family protein, partial [Motilibacter deserti]